MFKSAYSAGLNDTLPQGVIRSVPSIRKNAAFSSLFALQLALLFNTVLVYLNYI